MNVRCRLHVNVLSWDKVSCRDGGPFAKESEEAKVSFRRLSSFESSSSSPGGTTASLVTGNSTTLIFGSTPALRNWPRSELLVVFAFRGEQPRTTEW